VRALGRDVASSAHIFLDVSRRVPSKRRPVRRYAMLFASAIMIDRLRVKPSAEPSADKVSASVGCDHPFQSPLRDVSMIRASLAIAIGIVITLPLIEPASAACRHEVCSTGVEKGEWLYIALSSTARPYTHYNFRNLTLGDKQEEYPAGRPKIPVFLGKKRDFVRFRYSVQICNRGGLLHKSTCGPWADFVHELTSAPLR
jgi:hypothetical protein